MVITIYKIDASPPSRAVLMTAELLGLKIETKDVNTMAGEQFEPEYLEKNPAHTVPLLEDGDFVLADSHAIITYLVSKYGADLRSTLYPADLRIRATIDHRLFLDASLIFPKFKSVAISVLSEKASGPNPQHIVEVNELYGFIEKYLEKSEFLAEDHITVADISIVSSISSLDVMVPVSTKFTKIKEWLTKIERHDWYQKKNVPGLQDLAKFFKSS